jgi:hypothetical protein
MDAKEVPRAKGKTSFIVVGKTYEKLSHTSQLVLKFHSKTTSVFSTLGL